MGSKCIEDIKIKKLSINLGSVHFNSIRCVNILQCTVQKNHKIHFYCTVNKIPFEHNKPQPPQKRI